MMPRASVIPHLVVSLRQKRATPALSGLAIRTTVASFQSRCRATAPRWASTAGKSRLPPSRPREKPLKPIREEQPTILKSLKSTSHRSGSGYLWAVSIMGVVLGVYMTTLVLAEVRGRKLSSELDIEQNADVSERWRDKTRNFDHEVDNAEYVMLMRAKRSRLVKEAYGKVLEVSVGTGRNMDLYDLRPYDPREDKKYGRNRARIISSLTFNDQSEVMVEQAADKFVAMESRREEDERFEGDVTFVIGDARKPGVIDRPSGGYDTIVQTFGICSMAEPVEFLQRLGKLCRQPGEGVFAVPGEEDEGGHILLLEHGRGYYDWLNNILDGKAKFHALNYGCWWNKDIDQVVKDSGLKIERIRRYHGGTTWEIVLRPATTPSQKRT